MGRKKQICFSSGLAAAILIGGVGCISDGNSPSPKKGGGILGSMFGNNEDEDQSLAEAEAAKEKEKPAPRATATEFPIGSVQTVMVDEKFVLIRSSKGLTLEAGTEMMTYGLNGRPTAKLSLSPEKKGAFVVADIVQGNPKRGDRVIAMGMVDRNSRTTRGLVPANGLGGDDEIQILE